MTFRTRLLLVAMTTLAVGLGALLVLGNVLLAQRTRAEVSSVMRANADSQVSALIVTPTGVRVRETANDGVLDRRSWVFDGDRVIERPPEATAELDRIATRLGRARRTDWFYRPGTSRACCRSTTIQARAGPGHGIVPVRAAIASSGCAG